MTPSTPSDMDGPETPRSPVPDDRGLIGPDDFRDWAAIDNSIQKSQFWRSRCFDKEPALMKFVEAMNYHTIGSMGRRLSGLFHHQPWFAVVVNEALTESFLMGMYFGERRFHHSPDNLMPQIEYPDPTTKPAPPADEIPSEDEVKSDLDENDFD